MGLSIKDADTERKLRELAARRRRPMTRVVNELVTEALEREGPSEAEAKARYDKAMAFLEEFWKTLPPGPLPTDKERDAWLYDEDGNPTG